MPGSPPAKRAKVDISAGVEQVETGAMLFGAAVSGTQKRIHPDLLAGLHPNLATGFHHIPTARQGTLQTWRQVGRLAARNPGKCYQCYRNT